MCCPAAIRYVAILLLIMSTCAPAADELRIGSWNIEHLGRSRIRKDVGHEVAQSAEDLAEWIRRARVDVIALQEMTDNDNNDRTRRNRTMDVVFEILSEVPGQDWSYRLFENRNADDTSELCGIGWNKAAVTRIGRPYQVPIEHLPDDRYFEWDRHPQAMKFQVNGTAVQFVVISLHMKSGSRFAAQRRIEAQSLIAALPKVRNVFETEEIVLIGDCNVRHDNERALQIIEKDGFRNMLAPRTSTATFAFRPADRTFVPANSRIFSNSRQDVLAPTGVKNVETHRKYLSDHYMIVLHVPL